MSSFLVSREGLTILADGIDDMLRKGKIADYPVECEEFRTIYNDTDTTIDDVFYDLNYLNAHALKERYGDKIEDNLYWEGMCEIPEYNIDSYLKMLDCYHYQCCEGDTIETGFFKAIEKLVKAVEKHVDRKNSLLYQEASWG